MRKVTASLVTSLTAIFAGLAGCGPSSHVSSEWSFEAPAVEPGESTYAEVAEVPLPSNDTIEPYSKRPDFQQPLVTSAVSDRPTSTNRPGALSAPTQRVSLPASQPVSQPAQVKQSANPSVNPSANGPVPTAENSSAPVSTSSGDPLVARTLLAVSTPAPPMADPTQAERGTALETQATLSADGLPRLPALAPRAVNEPTDQQALHSTPLEAAASAPDASPVTPVTADAAIPDIAVSPSESASIALTLASLTQSLPGQNSVLLADLLASLDPAPKTTPEAISIWTLPPGLSAESMFESHPAKLAPKAGLYSTAGYLHSPLMEELMAPSALQPVIHTPTEDTPAVGSAFVARQSAVGQFLEDSH